MKQHDLTSGSVTRNIWRLAIPMMAETLLQNTFNFVDMIFVGKLGPDAIAAVAMSGIMLSMIFTIAIGISVGTVALVARYTGAKKLSAVENVTFQSLWLGVFGSLLISWLGYWLAGDILRALGAEPGVVSQGIPYIRVMFLGAFTLFLAVALGAALRGAGDAVTPLKMLTGSTLLNLVLDPILIFGLVGAPRLGVAGSALATVLSRALGCGYLFWKCMNGQGLFTLHLRHLRFDWRTMGALLRIGVFGSIQAALRNLSGLVLMRIVATYGTATVAAYGIGMRLQFMIMMPAFGIANAVATLVGQNLGAYKPDRAELSARRAARSGFVFMTLAGFGYILLARSLIQIFNTDAEVVRQGVLYLRTTAGFVGFIGLSIIFGRAFNGAGDTISPMVITGIALFLLRIPLALGGALLWNVGGLFAGIATSSVLQGLIMRFWFGRGTWKTTSVGVGLSREGESG